MVTNRHLVLSANDNPKIYLLMTPSDHVTHADGIIEVKEDWKYQKYDFESV
jgi:hypothetical protein